MKPGTGMLHVAGPRTAFGVQCCQICGREFGARVAFDAGVAVVERRVSDETVFESADALGIAVRVSLCVRLGLATLPGPVARQPRRKWRDRAV